MRLIPLFVEIDLSLLSRIVRSWRGASYERVRAVIARTAAAVPSRFAMATIVSTVKPSRRSVMTFRSGLAGCMPGGGGLP